MRYRKALDQFNRHATADWGTFTCYLEIADDGFAWRQANLYGNGYGLRYDREHWVDLFGELGEARHTQSFETLQKLRSTLLEIDSVEFDAAWNKVARAPNQPQQYDASSYAGVSAQLGPRTPEQLRRLPPWIARLFENGS